MGDLRTAGALWIMAGLTCAGLGIFVFIGENLKDLSVLLESPGLPTLVFGGAIVALLIGSLLMTRPGPGVVRVSSVAGVAWLVVFGSLVLSALNGPESGPVLSSSLITGFGVAGAVVAYRSRSAGRPA